jgi:hypothetical protein
LRTPTARSSRSEARAVCDPRANGRRVTSREGGGTCGFGSAFIAGRCAAAARGIDV